MRVCGKCGSMVIPSLKLCVCGGTPVEVQKPKATEPEARISEQMKWSDVGEFVGARLTGTKAGAFVGHLIGKIMDRPAVTVSAPSPEPPKLNVVGIDFKALGAARTKAATTRRRKTEKRR